VLAARQISLVYGGAYVGLMGAVADAVLASGGRVSGVIPEALVAKEVAHPV
jgi:predicted Rossmann-fold nucleotide-binding protein